jgi:hypothetical protein
VGLRLGCRVDGWGFGCSVSGVDFRVSGSGGGSQVLLRQDDVAVGDVLAEVHHRQHLQTSIAG